MSNRGARGPRGRQSRRGGKRESQSNGSATSSTSKSEFRTDSDIAASAPVVERKLEKWQDDGASDVGTLADSADSGNWDQFEVNSRKFGVKDTYDEHIYTTAIDKNHPEYEQRARRAEKLAREIEGQQTTNVHLKEERGQKVEDEVDEESKYSGVERVADQEAKNRANDDKEFADKNKKGKKFNFAASAAKATAFRPTQPAVPQFFVPGPAPYVNQYGMMMPYGYYPPHFPQ